MQGAVNKSVWMMREGGDWSDDESDGDMMRMEGDGFRIEMMEGEEGDEIRIFLGAKTLAAATLAAAGAAMTLF